MDKVVEAVEKVKKEWDEAYTRTQEHIKAIEEYGKSSEERNSSFNSLPRLNGVAQDDLALLSALQFNLDLLAPQLPIDDEVQFASALLESMKKQSHNLRLSLRNANLQAKANVRKAAQGERELLLRGGAESAIRRRNLQGPMVHIDDKGSKGVEAVARASLECSVSLSSHISASSLQSPNGLEGMTKC